MNIDNVASVLKLNNLYVEHCSFDRSSEQVSDSKLQLSINRNNELLEDDTHKIILNVRLSNSLKEFLIKITLVGLFSVSSSTEKMKDTLLEKNAIAIMFPYLRAQVTLLSSQPGMNPIIIPPINIIALLDDANTEK